MILGTYDLIDTQRVLQEKSHLTIRLYESGTDYLHLLYPVVSEVDKLENIALNSDSVSYCEVTS